MGTGMVQEYRHSIVNKHQKEHGTERSHTARRRSVRSASMSMPCNAQGVQEGYIGNTAMQHAET